MLKRSFKKEACSNAWRCCSFWKPPKKRSNRFSAQAVCGTSKLARNRSGDKYPAPLALKG